MNRKVIITGATSGIGKAIMLRYLENNDFVIAIGRNLAKIKEINEKYKNKCELYKLDVSKRVEVDSFYLSLREKHKEIDVLINAAGFSKLVHTKMDFNEAVNSWESIISTNLSGAFMMSLGVSPLLKRPGGRIINISSIGAFSGGNSIGGVAYASSKAGINGLTFGLARELSGEGITVNSIAPGFIENTEFTSVYTEDQKKKIIDNIPVKRAGNANDIVETCYFLCSENASYITGEIINVNGGWMFGH
jgi:3-oxoacyl-[acyl-carrier protein] reductase